MHRQRRAYTMGLKIPNPIWGPSHRLKLLAQTGAHPLPLWARPINSFFFANVSRVQFFFFVVQPAWRAAREVFFFWLATPAGFVKLLETSSQFCKASGAYDCVFFVYVFFLFFLFFHIRIFLNVLTFLIFVNLSKFPHT